MAGNFFDGQFFGGGFFGALAALVRRARLMLRNVGRGISP